MNMKAALIALLVSLSVAHAQEDISKVETRKEAEKFARETFLNTQAAIDEIVIEL